MPEKKSRIRPIGGFGGGLGATTGTGKCDCESCVCENTKDTTSNVKVSDVTAVYHVGNPLATRT